MNDHFYPTVYPSLLSTPKYPNGNRKSTTLWFKCCDGRVMPWLLEGGDLNVLSDTLVIGRIAAAIPPETGEFIQILTDLGVKIEHIEAWLHARFAPQGACNCGGLDAYNNMVGNPTNALEEWLKGNLASSDVYEQAMATYTQLKNYLLENVGISVRIEDHVEQIPHLVASFCHPREERVTRTLWRQALKQPGRYLRGMESDLNALSKHISFRAQYHHAQAVAFAHQHQFASHQRFERIILSGIAHWPAQWIEVAEGQPMEPDPFLVTIFGRGETALEDAWIQVGYALAHAKPQTRLTVVLTDHRKLIDQVKELIRSVGWRQRATIIIICDGRFSRTVV